MSVNEAFDPSAPEGESRPGSAYVSRKDVKVVGVALVFLGMMMYPVFRVLARRTEKAKCIMNMKGIMDSINQYATLNEDKFPPVFATGGADEPMLQASGAPYTWASDLFEYMNPRAKFVCPSADKSEYSFSQNPRSDTLRFPLSYGMFAPLSAFSRSLVEDPNEAILVGETSNLGARNTFDPLPFVNSGGQKMPFDGMAIGWDTDNFDGDARSKYVTRLAFPDTANGVFPEKGDGRHDEGTFVLSVTGQLRTVKPSMARVERRYGNIYGTWPMPLTAKRHH